MRRVRVARIRGTTFGAAEKIRVNVDWTATKLCFIPDTIATSYLLHLDFPSGLFKILPLLFIIIIYYITYFITTSKYRYRYQSEITGNPFLVPGTYRYGIFVIIIR